MKSINKLVEYINKIYYIVAIVFLAILSVACIIQVFTRVVLNASMVGTEEAARFAFIWMSLLGMSLCTANQSNASVDLVNGALKGNSKRIHNILIHLVIMIFAFVLIAQGGRLLTIVARQLSPTLRIRMNYVYVACPIGGIGMVINCLAIILNEIDAIRKGGNAECSTQ